jgi:hypothetical protein
VFFLWFPPISSHYQTARQTQRGRGLIRTLASSVSSLSPCRDLRISLAIVCPYKTRTRGPVRVHPWPYEFSMELQIGTPYSLRSWAACQAHIFTYCHTAQYFHPTPWTWERVSPQKAVTSSLWKVTSLPFCLLRNAWIQTQVLTYLMSGVLLPSLVPIPHGVPLCIWGPHPNSLARRMNPSSRSSCPLVPSGIFSQQSGKMHPGDHVLAILDNEPPRNVAGNW